MELQIYIDDSDLAQERINEITPLIQSAIANWIKEQTLNISLLSDSKSNINSNLNNEKLGVHLQIKSKFKLKEPLIFLYKLAKQHKCEFVIAMVDTNSGNTEEVCYFGDEEGRPDLFEIANYLSL